MNDVALNILGFLPFGFLTDLKLQQRASWSDRRIRITTVVLAVLLSFAIESTQTYIPGRDSSSVNLLMNMIGAILGVLIIGLSAVTTRFPAFAASRSVEQTIGVSQDG